MGLMETGVKEADNYLCQRWCACQTESHTSATVNVGLERGTGVEVSSGSSGVALRSARRGTLG